MALHDPPFVVGCISTNTSMNAWHFASQIKAQLHNKIHEYRTLISNNNEYLANQ